MKCSWVILLRDTTQIGDVSLDVFLEAAQPLDQADRLQVVAMLSAESSEIPPVQAALHWGDYQSTALFDRNGRAEFSPVMLREIWDEAQHTFTHDTVFRRNFARVRRTAHLSRLFAAILGF